MKKEKREQYTKLHEEMSKFPIREILVALAAQCVWRKEMDWFESIEKVCIIGDISKETAEKVLQ